MCNCLSIGRYIPDATGAIYDVLKEMSQSRSSKKKRYDNEDADLLGKVSARLVTKETLREKLAQHVEQVTASILSNNQFLNLKEVEADYGLGLLGQIYQFCSSNFCRWTMRWHWSMLHRVE